MKTNTILGALLIISVATNIYFWRDKSDQITTCYSTPGFDKPTSISKEEARGFVEQYQASLSKPDSILGGIITRSSLDEIMCTKDCNAIVYALGRDSTGELGPGSNGVFTILSGAKIDYDSQTQTIKSVTDLGIRLYVPRNWCPPTCMAQ